MIDTRDTRLMITVIAITLAAGGSLVHAQSAGAEKGAAGDSLFEQLDTDKNSYLTKEEARKSAEVQAQFRSMDANGDGKISASEWQSHLQSGG